MGKSCPHNLNRIALVVLAFSILAGCRTIDQHSADIAEPERLANLESWTWRADPVDRTGDTLGVAQNPILRERVREAITAEMAAKGYRPAADDEVADLEVDVSFSSREKVYVRRYPTFGPTGFHYGFWHGRSASIYRPGYGYRPYYGGFRGFHPLDRWRHYDVVDVIRLSEAVLAVNGYDGKSGDPLYHGWTRTHASEFTGPAPKLDQFVAGAMKQLPASISEPGPSTTAPEQSDGENNGEF